MTKPTVTASPTRPAKLTLSASAVKSFVDCSWLFYQTRVLKVPDFTHPKTLLGSLAHSILEAFARPKHRDLLEATIHHQTVYGSPVLTRLVKLFREKHPDVTDEIIADLDKLVFVALNHDFNCKGAKRVLEPEHSFEIDYGEFAVRGVMDRVVLYDDHAVIRDYKTQGKRFSQSDLDWSIQAFCYQLAVMHEFGLPSEVEFILLRHPGNRKDPTKHLQVVPAASVAQIEGFKYHLADVNEQINALTLETSMLNLKAERDEGFCLRVCSLKDPFDYWVLLGDVERPLASTRVPKIGIGDENPDEWAARQLAPKEGQYVEKRRYNGCCYFYSKSGRRRNWQQ